MDSKTLFYASVQKTSEDWEGEREVEGEGEGRASAVPTHWPRLSCFLSVNRGYLTRRMGCARPNTVNTRKALSRMRSSANTRQKVNPRQRRGRADLSCGSRCP